MKFQKIDLDTNRKLLKDGFISATRVAQLEGTVADYGVKIEERRSELARADQPIDDATCASARRKVTSASRDGRRPETAGRHAGRGVHQGRGAHPASIPGGADHASAAARRAGALKRHSGRHNARRLDR